MAGTTRTALGAKRDRLELSTDRCRLRRLRRKVTPGAEMLESRACPSPLANVPAIDRVEQVHLVHLDEAGRLGGGQSGHHGGHRTDAHRAISKTIVVRPGGNINAAIRRARPGSIIQLAGGVYTRTANNPLLHAPAGINVNHKRNITILGAPDGSTVIAPAAGDAIDITLSSGITVANVWLRATGSGGRGLFVMASSVNVQSIRTDQTQLDGVVAYQYQGRTANLTATNSHFDGVQSRWGMALENGAVATISNCTFNNNGTGPNVNPSSDGLVLTGNAQATITGSQFSGNYGTGLVALNSSQVRASQSTFSSNRNGDGALFFNQTTADLSGNTFASNGQVFGPTTGFNGLEFFSSFTGTASISGNTFQNNTGNGLYIGSAPSTIQVVNNVFDNNFVGLDLDGRTAPVNVTAQGNTFSLPLGAPSSFEGIFALGSGVNATVGGPGSASNSLSNFANGLFIDPSPGGGGCPNLTILTNTFLQRGQPVDPSVAVSPC